MSWLALVSLGGEPRTARGFSRGAPALRRGTLLFEAHLGDVDADWVLLDLPWGGHPCRIRRQANGMLTLELGSCQATLPAEKYEPFQSVGLSITWDCDAGWAEFAQDHPARSRHARVTLPAPLPMEVGALGTLLDAPRSCLAQAVTFAAVSDRVQPLGPWPGLTGQTPIMTMQGMRPVEAIHAGDLVITMSGRLAPVIAKTVLEVPALGRTAPVRLQAPYLELDQDIVVAADQFVALRGIEVEYTFGHEAVLARASDLTHAHNARPEPYGPIIRYHQLLLPGGECVMSAGLCLSSLHLGRLRRHPTHLARSLMAGLGSSYVPEHATGQYLVLRADEAKALMAQRAA